MKTSLYPPYSHCNYTITDYTLCTPETCCLAQGPVAYLPTLAGNSIYLVIFIFLFFIHVWLGVRHRTWGFLVGIACGTILEILGYGGRLMLHNNLFDQPAFLLYIVCLTIAPAFLTASIYLCLSRIIVSYGTHLSRFQPRTYTLTFIFFDVIALLLQAGGAAMTSSNNNSTLNTGIHIMLAGLVWQVISLFFFMVLCAEFAWRVIRPATPVAFTEEFAAVRSSYRFKGFQWALALATVTVFVRCCFRVAELDQGFKGSIAKNETLFMIFEGPMIFISIATLGAFHPGSCLGDAWHAAQWSLRGRKIASPQKQSDVPEPRVGEKEDAVEIVFQEA